MKKGVLPSSYLSAFCLELSLTLQAGIPVEEGLSLMGDDERNQDSKALLSRLGAAMERGEQLSGAMAEEGVFPDYLVSMVALGEQTGKLENTLNGLAEYYKRQENLSASIRSAVFYPLILLLIMLIVILVLIIKVLPIFNDVFNQLGMQMSQAAVYLMEAGRWLSEASIVIAIVIGCILAAAMVVALVPALRIRAAELWRKIASRFQITKKIASARFAFAMAMTLSSGMDLDQALEDSRKLCGGQKEMAERIDKCQDRILSGERMGKALFETGIFSARDSRLLALAEKTGSMPEIMGKIAQSSEEAVQGEIDGMIGRIEPALVILTSVIVGVILLSVMLPLLGIMSSIG